MRLIFDFRVFLSLLLRGCLLPVACLVLSASSFPSWAQTYTGKVVRVADGDTFTLLVDGNRELRIRLSCIDTPERGQPYGKQATAALRRWLKQPDLKVQQLDTDRYGRIIGRLTVQDSINVNLRLVQAGWAWCYTYYCDLPAYQRAEAQARAQHLGLWQAANPVAPWVWRRRK